MRNLRNDTASVDRVDRKLLHGFKVETRTRTKSVREMMDDLEQDDENEED